MMSDIRSLYQKLMAARPLLESALANGIGAYSFADIKEAVMAGDMQLWTLDSSAAITEIVRYPQYTAVVIVLGAGNMDELRDAVPEVEEFARIVGAQRILVCGRLGWLRALKDKGFTSAQAWAVKEVSA